MHYVHLNYNISYVSINSRLGCIFSLLISFDGYLCFYSVSVLPAAIIIWISELCGLLGFHYFHVRFFFCFYLDHMFLLILMNIFVISLNVTLHQCHVIH